MPHCYCDMHRAKYDRKYVEKIDRGWPHWLAYLISSPRSKNYDEAKEFVFEYDKAFNEGRIAVGILGAFIVDDIKLAQEVTRTFGLRFLGGKS